ncbi:MAG: hypothetical protein K2M17_00060 [Bacilli bacterium]|nr:hypothetical protein [Bacilli bacterium]
MSNSVIDKYLAKKKKDLLEYAKILESIIAIEKNNLWSTKLEFSGIAGGVIGAYVDDYYFDNSVHRDNPVEYSNDKLNSVLKSLIKYCKELEDKTLLQDKKNETFLLSAIICTACWVDIVSNVADGDFVDVESKFKYLLQYLQKTNILKVDAQNDKVIQMLFEKIKESVVKETEFFTLFESEISYNQYKCITSEPEYYLLSYHHEVAGLDAFDSKMVREIEKEFEDTYLEISYELLAIELLKEWLGNGDVRHFLIPISESALKKPSLFGSLYHSFLKSQVKILVPYEMNSDHKEEINILETLGYSILYEYKGNDEVSAKTFLRNLEVLVSKEFYNKNEDKMLSWNSQGVHFVIKNDNEEDVL